MNRTLLTLASLAILTAPAAAAPPQGSGTAWDIVSGLTSEVGPRLDGSSREAAARDWAVARLKALGLANVRVEPFTIKGFVRGDDRARLVAPTPQPLAITALGYSAPTPAQGIEGDVVWPCRLRRSFLMPCFFSPGRACGSSLA